MIYPWLTYSSQTKARQREINLLAITQGRCPPLKEDGKLGPTTCGVAANYAGLSSNISAMQKSCKQTKTQPVSLCPVLPWLSFSAETLTLQVGLNAQLVPQGFCKMKEDGKLGPTTCAAAKKVLGANAAKLGCRQTGSLKVCASASNTSQPIAIPVVPTPAPVPALTPIAPAPQAPDDPTPVVPTPPPTQEPVETGPAPETSTGPVKEEGMASGTMAIIGVGVLAVGAGTYFLLKKKKR